MNRKVSPKAAELARGLSQWFFSECSGVECCAEDGRRCALGKREDASQALEGGASGLLVCLG